MHPIRALRPFALISAFLIACPKTAVAETVLDRVLARIEAGPLQIFDGLHVNYAEQGDPAVEEITTTVDGSITVITHSSRDRAGTSSAGAVTVTEPADPGAPLSFEVEVSTSSIGANNVGVIEVDHQRVLLAPESATASSVSVMPGYGVVALNAASNRSNVLGSVSMVSSPATLKAGSVSTSAIGATNSGSINVALSTSEVTGP